MIEQTDFHETESDNTSEAQQSDIPVDEQDVEGLDTQGGSWGDYPIDELLIRHESRTIYEVIRRIEKGSYVMDPDFQRDFIWEEDKQSKLIESVLMRIPLPVFYLAEDGEGRMIVVDGLQRLSTFQNFVSDGLRLRLPERADLNSKKFKDLEAKLQNRIEDCNLIFYIIDSKAPDRARLDIFDRVNSGKALTPQQMRNSLFMGPATRFLKKEANSEVFHKATDGSLNWKIMRDREFVNRFCAFQLLGLDEYRGDMDVFLGECLRRMNRIEEANLAQLSDGLRRSLANNYMLFKRQAFRKPTPELRRRSVLNASLWDVMSTGLSCYPEARISACAERLRNAILGLFDNDSFYEAITFGTNDTRRVKTRFKMTRDIFEDILGSQTTGFATDLVADSDSNSS